MRKIIKSKIVSFLLMIVFVLQMFSTELYDASDIPSMYSGAYALTDGGTGRLLCGKNENNPMANASTTKILTCIVTLENSDMAEVVTISSNASNQPKVRLGMGEGEQYPLSDLLYGLMLESYNDCAVAIAEHVAGSEKEFSKLVNKKAKEIGCLDTYFITPNGLDAEDDKNFHHTTALDLCRIMEYCVWESPKSGQFLKITQTLSYQGSNGTNNYSFSNKNTLLNSLDGLISGKTGFTSKAGYCYVAAYEKDGERYCIALLACGWPNNKTYKWQDARALLSFGRENYHLVTLEKEKIEESMVVDGFIDDPMFGYLNKRMEIYLAGTFSERIILLNENEQIKKEIEFEENLVLPIQKGQRMGTCTLYIGDYLIDSIPLIAYNNAKEWDLGKVFRSIFRQYVNF